MKIEKFADQDVALLVLKGEFESEQCDPFLADVEDFIQKGYRSLILNMRVVRFINSTAIGTIIKTRNRLNELGGELVISHPSGFVTEVTSTIGLDKAVKIFGDDKEAIQYLRKKAEDQSAVEFRDENAVLFTFESQDKTRMLGRPFGVGKISSLSTEDITFQWTPMARQGTKGPERDELGRLFEANTAIRLKFRLPLYKKGYFFEIPSEIRDAAVGGDGAVTVQADFIRVKDEDRESIRRFVDDMRYLKRELGEEGA